MEIGVKQYRSGSLVRDITLLGEVSIKYSLSERGEARFNVPFSSDFLAFDIIEIYENDGINDKVVFTGFVFEATRSITSSEDTTSVLLLDKKALFLNKLVLDDTFIAEKSFGDAFTENLQHYINNFNETWNVIDNSGETTEDTSIKFQVLYDYFNQITENKKLYRWVEGNNVYIDKQRGEDRTIKNSNYVEVLYDGTLTNDTTKEVRYISQAQSANVVISKASLSGSPAQSGIASTGYTGDNAVVFLTIVGGGNQGFLDEVAEEKLEEKKKQNAVFSVLIDDGAQLTNGTGTVSAGIGDIISFQVQNVEGLPDQKVSLTVVNYDVIYSGGNKKEVFLLGDTTVKLFSSKEIFRRLQRDVDRQNVL